jgi:AraC-like DNA-binding protein
MPTAYFAPTLLPPLLRLLANEGISSDSVLANTSVSEEDIFSKTNIKIDNGLKILQNAINLSHNELLGLDLGKCLGLNTSVVGYAVMAAENMRSVLEIAIEMHSLNYPSAEAEIEYFPDTILITYNHAYQNSSVQRLLTLTLISMQIVHSTELFAHATPPRPLTIELDFPDDGKIDSYREAFYCDEITFGAPRASISWTSEFLDVPRPNFDHAISEQMRGIALQRLAQLSEAPNLSDLLKSLLLDAPPPIPNLNEAAKKLCMSSRTLRRKLAELNTSYQEILTSTRLQIAQEYLQKTDLSIKQISELCGFTESHNFSLAFKRWTQLSPTEYRKKNQPSPQ